MPILKENCPEEHVDESSPCSNLTSCSSQTNKIKHENHAELLGSNGTWEHGNILKWPGCILSLLLHCLKSLQMQQ